MKFWGVRGSTPTPYAENLGYGGNTPCLEIRYPGLPPMIFDGGTGLRRLGLSLLKEFPAGGECLIFLTHFHWDHIQGIPFFFEMYRPDWTIRFHSKCESWELEKLLGDQMRDPYFPVEMPAVQATRIYRHVPPSGLAFSSLCVRPIPLFHPNGCNGYRIDAGGRSIVYATDHEHGNASFDRSLIEAAAAADILIYDSQYTPEEYESRRGWGHSTWREAVRMASEAGVGQLILFHHDPEHDDETMSRIVDQAQKHFPNTMAATEGWTKVLE